MWLVLLLSVARASSIPAGCERALTRDALTDALGRAESAVRALDQGVLDLAMADAGQALACADRPITPVDLARYYRLRGITAFVDGDRDAATAWFAAQKHVDPGGQLDPGLLSAPILEVFAAATPAPDGIGLPPPAEGRLLVDGVGADTLPQGRGVFVQWIGEDGLARQGWLVAAGDPVPEYPIAPRAPPVPSSAGEPARVSRTLLAVGLASLAVGGGAAAGAVVTERSILGSDLASDELGGRVAVNRGLAYGSYGLFATAAGFGVAAVVVGRW